jgi:2EXR family
MTSSGETKQRFPLLTFPRFSDLAFELRNQIWQHALHSATVNRVIPVEINHHPAVIMHSCLPLLESFCGQHSYCPLYVVNSRQPSSSVVCMFNGYFSLPVNISDIEDAALHSLSLACTESHSVVLSQYPETMTIYRKTWYPDDESHQRRQVRCNPATDTLLITTVPSYSSEQRHPSSSRSDPGDLYHQTLEKWFPQDADIFSNFRSMISTFRHVGFTCVSDLQTPGPLLFSQAFDCTLFQRLLTFFERLEHLYLCSDPEHEAAVREWERVEYIEDPRDDLMDNSELPNFVGVSSSILNRDSGFKDYVRAQMEFSANSGECCWVPIPKGVGGSWLFRSRDVSDRKW